MHVYFPSYFLIIGTFVGSYHVFTHNQELALLHRSRRTATVVTHLLLLLYQELALLHRSRRTATVVTEQEPVQLLTIGREDFLDIFMSGATSDGIPEHIRYVQSLDFMKDWPTDLLLERPECCLFHFFKSVIF